MEMQPDSPIHSRAGGLSASPSPGLCAHDACAGSPRPAQRHACSVPLAQWLACVYLSTDPQDISDLLGEGVDERSRDPDPDDIDPEDMAPDTDQSAASSKMGDEHVMAIIEHIITASTPVAEANALLGILTDAGTMPWRTLEPYLKTLRAWHSECGRQPVQHMDIGIPVRTHVILVI